jgi:hypothetical protein
MSVVVMNLLGEAELHGPWRRRDAFTTLKFSIISF